MLPETFIGSSHSMLVGTSAMFTARGMWDGLPRMSTFHPRYCPSEGRWMAPDAAKGKISPESQVRLELTMRSAVPAAVRRCSKLDDVTS